MKFIFHLYLYFLNYRCLNCFLYVQSNEAKSYFDMWSEWRRKPTKSNRKNLKKSLSKYASRLRKDYINFTHEKPLQVLGLTFPKSNPNVRQFWLDTAWKALGQIPPVGFGIFIAERSWAGMKLYYPKHAALLKDTALRSKSKRLKLHLETTNTTAVNTQVIKKL